MLASSSLTLSLMWINLHESASVFFPVASQGIVDEISKLMSGKATGPFSIPVKILKIIKYVISKPLELRFNASFSLGEVPSSFKIAK